MRETRHTTADEVLSNALLNIEHSIVPGNTLECLEISPNVKDYSLPAVCYAF